MTPEEAIRLEITKAVIDVHKMQATQGFRSFDPHQALRDSKILSDYVTTGKSPCREETEDA